MLWDEDVRQGTTESGMLAALVPSSAVIGYICMLLVALQVGLQPLVTRSCVGEASTKSLVLAENAITAVLSLSLTTPAAFAGWSLADSLTLAGPPALVYAIRSICKQGAYRRCDAVTFNIINQTKTVFCAIAAWVLLGEGQSFQQCSALLCAIAAGALLVVPQRSAKGGDGKEEGEGDAPPKALVDAALDKDGGEPMQRQQSPSSPARRADAAPLASARTVGLGLILAVATAFCSGTAAALSQMAFRRAGSRPSTLFTFELALWGSPVAILLGGSGPAPPGAPARSSRCSAFWELRRGWRLRTVAPVALQAAGGVLVGRVVKQHGGVAMGLCTIVGIGVSAAADAAVTRKPPSVRQALAGTLAASSVVAHQMDS